MRAAAAAVRAPNASRAAHQNPATARLPGSAETAKKPVSPLPKSANTPRMNVT